MHGDEEGDVVVHCDDLDVDASFIETEVSKA